MLKDIYFDTLKNIEIYEVCVFLVYSLWSFSIGIITSSHWDTPDSACLLSQFGDLLYNGPKLKTTQVEATCVMIQTLETSNLNILISRVYRSKQRYFVCQ